MWCRVDLVWADVSEERIASIFMAAPAHVDSSLADFFYPEDGGDTLLRNVGSHKIYTASHPRRSHSS
jgi:hypothetical protein